jgi:ribonuclease E
LKECLRHDRARIQVGHISHFGLLEMSRQRIRSSVLESSTEKCPHCGGTGHVRSVSSVALQLLRALEEMLLKGATHNLAVRTRSDIALYLLNHKRAHLRTLEERFRIAIMVNADATIGGQLSFVIEKGEQVHSLEQAKALALQPATAVPIVDEEDLDAEDVSESEATTAVPASEEDTERDEELDQEQGQGRSRRRRRRRGRRGSESRETLQADADHDGAAMSQEPPADFAAAPDDDDVGGSDEARETGNGVAGADMTGEPNGEGERRRRRRGRRGGRRNRRGREGEGLAAEPELAHAGADLDRPEAAGVEAGPVSELEAAAVHAPNSGRESDEPAPAGSEPAQNRAVEVAAAPVAEPPEVPEPIVAAPPRRRSTVREPAPQVLSDDGSLPAPSFTQPPAPVEPVVSSSAESEASDRPRRSGWWSKRVFGKG